LAGLVQFGFFACGAVSSILIGPFVDKTKQRNQLIIGLLALNAFIALSIFFLIPNSKAGFFYFFLLRCCSGVSVGSCFPVLYSLCGDLFTTSSLRGFAA